LRQFYLFFFNEILESADVTNDIDANYFRDLSYQPQFDTAHNVADYNL
jgi:hypothetical protein